MQQLNIRFIQIPRWQIALGAGLLIALLLTLFILALGIFFLVLPIFLIGGALAYFFGGRALKTRPTPNDRVLEVDYRVIEPERLDKDRNGGSS